MDSTKSQGWPSDCEAGLAPTFCSTHTWLVTHLLDCWLPSARETFLARETLALARESVLAGFIGFLARLRRTASWEEGVMAELEVRDATSRTGRKGPLFQRELGSDPRILTTRRAARSCKLHQTYMFDVSDPQDYNFFFNPCSGDTESLAMCG